MAKEYQAVWLGDEISVMKYPQILYLPWEILCWESRLWSVVYCFVAWVCLASFSFVWPRVCKKSVGALCKFYFFRVYLRWHGRCVEIELDCLFIWVYWVRRLSRYYRLDLHFARHFVFSSNVTCSVEHSHCMGKSRWDVHGQGVGERLMESLWNIKRNSFTWNLDNEDD